MAATDPVEAAAIVLTLTQGTFAVKPENIYFTFASGRMAYDCVACNARCCCGYGYSARRAEVDLQVKVRPSLRFFLENGAAVGNVNQSVLNCPPACFFLDARGRCGIQAQEGYAAKPETCRLFPFNSFRRAGDYLIVSPHDGLCPLTVTPPGTIAKSSTYDYLVLEMQAGGISTNVQECTAVGMELKAAIANEQAVVQLSQQYSSCTRYSEFFGAQLAARGRATGPAAKLPEGTDYVSGFLGRVCELLGTTPSLVDPQDSDLVRTMVAITPYVRSRMVFAPASGEGAPVLGVDRAPHFAMAVHVLAALATSAGMGAVTFQTVTMLLRQFEPLLMLLASGDDVMAWAPNALIDLSATPEAGWQRPYLRIARALLPSAQRGAKRPLNAVFLEAAAFGEVERVLFLKEMARRIMGRVVPLDAVPGAGRHRQRFRPALQRWALGNLGEELIGVAVDRRRRRLHVSQA